MGGVHGVEPRHALGRIRGLAYCPLSAFDHRLGYANHVHCAGETPDVVGQEVAWATVVELLIYLAEALGSLIHLGHVPIG